MSFFTILAWVFAVLSTGLLILRIIGFVLYDEQAKLIDNLRGFEVSFPITWPGIVAFVCWTWIISGGI